MATQKVHLRQKGLSKGIIGYYLDYSIKGNRKQETIKGIKTYSRPKNKSERDHNKNFEFKLNEIRNHREQELLSNYFGETILYKPKTTLVSFCECIMEEKRGMKKTYDVWKSMLVHLKRFDCNVQLGELNEQWQNKWQSYLLSQGETFNNCAPQHPTGVLTILGTADAISDYNGIIFNGIQYYMSAAETHEYWATANNCVPNPTMTTIANTNTSDGSSVERYT